MSKLSDRDQRLYEMALADVKKAERMLPAMDMALGLIEGKRRPKMRHSNYLPDHEIFPRWLDGMPAWCENCGATLTEAEVDAINRNREVHAANLRLVEGPGPAERGAEDENGRLE